MCLYRVDFWGLLFCLVGDVCHLQNESLREQSHRLHESEPTFCWNRKNKTMTSKFIKCWLSFTIYRISYSLAASTTRNQFFAGIEKTKQWPANFERFFFVDVCASTGQFHLTTEFMKLNKMNSFDFDFTAPYSISGWILFFELWESFYNSERKL